MIKRDKLLYCSFNNIGVIWSECQWVVLFFFVYKRVLREHASEAMEIQIKKDKTMTTACLAPIHSYFCPEEDYISVHVRVAGDFTSALAATLGWWSNVNPPVNKVLPCVMVDGPFGSVSEDFSNYGTVLLVGAGIGVTPLASILKSISYQMTSFNNSKSTRLSKVYFTWEQETKNRIEISIYLTAKVKEDDMSNVTAELGPSLLSIVDKHPDTDVGACFCGPPVLSKTCV
ncbi:hypothetical protein JB92DRAFT_3083019 [Gautieria morchelliformis]|nr:hypothetical protein JB92DRAFT_3083019 [Gautieria morchelliformis]